MFINLPQRPQSNPKEELFDLKYLSYLILNKECQWHEGAVLFLTFFTFRLIRSIEAVVFSVTPQILRDAASSSAEKLSWFAFYYKRKRIETTVRSLLMKQFIAWTSVWRDIMCADAFFVFSSLRCTSTCNIFASVSLSNSYISSPSQSDSPQFSSSVLSPQSSNPSHSQNFGLQRPFLHFIWDASHSEQRHKEKTKTCYDTLTSDLCLCLSAPSPMVPSEDANLEKKS